jgi:hypothetical protein
MRSLDLIHVPEPAMPIALGTGHVVLDRTRHSSPAFTMSVYQPVTDGMTEQAATALGAALALPSEIRQKSG